VKHKLSRSFPTISARAIKVFRRLSVSYMLQNGQEMCRLTHKFAKGGRYASEEENGEDMRQRGMTTISAKRAISARRTFFTSQVVHEANYLVEEGPTSQLWAGLRGSSIVPT
jgi:hypothetical protein